SLALAKRAQSSGTAEPLSVYVHVPFCESLCYYCACNKVITKHHERASEYLEVLAAEIDLVVGQLGRGQSVAQVHFGGGSPTFLSDAELQQLLQALRAAFRFTADAEMSIEVDPRTVTPERLRALRSMGFNRLSFGVQDFDPDVQRAVHRLQPHETVRVLMDSARHLAFTSINADLIYGLPKQTPASFARTLEQMVQLRPDRIALYAYAHLPTRFKSQRRILAEDLPGAAQRTGMLGAAIASFLSHGYEYIGMDHFALTDDSLAVAKREGRLQRNFQGYSTHKDCDLIGLGASAIGRVDSTYYQNAKTLPEYYDAVRQGRLPVARGVSLTADDVLRRRVIMDLMCQGRLDFASVESAHAIRVTQYFARELQQLTALAREGLVELSSEAIVVTPKGWYLARVIAMVFDKYLQVQTRADRFSRVL
ncbi:MAG TPA: oxygen-independent coproporphyrinogen III oxidase, partial [Burkholderiaceae bacterium]|nr:oxygen-independent coproporphyrinogen III oxidase [Burkholderiaceae bacterium]